MKELIADAAQQNAPPGRVFLDSSTLQTLQDYGDFIYDGQEIARDNRIRSVPDGIENLAALQKIMRVAGRSSLQFVLSQNSLREVLDRGRFSYLQWALEMVDYWEGCLAVQAAGEPAISVSSEALAEKLVDRQFGYLSAKDAKLIQDAVALECDVFLTMERRLPRNADHLQRELGIRVLQPLEYWGLLKPWIPLLF